MSLRNRLAAPSARAVEPSGALVVDGGLGRDERGASEQAAEVDKVFVAASTGEDLHAYRVADRDISAEQFVDAVADGASGVARGTRSTLTSR